MISVRFFPDGKPETENSKVVLLKGGYPDFKMVAAAFETMSNLFAGNIEIYYSDDEIDMPSRAYLIFGYDKKGEVLPFQRT